jgi:hypothetical protein
MSNAKRACIGLVMALGAFAEERRACMVVEHPAPLDSNTRISLGGMAIYGFSVPLIVHLKDGKVIEGGLVDGDKTYLRLKVKGGFCDLARKDIERMEKGRK